MYSDSNISAVSMPTHLLSSFSGMVFDETHPLFELLSLLNGHRVCFGYDRNNVDWVTQALHELYV